MTICHEATIRQNGMIFRATLFAGTEECMERVTILKGGKRLERIHESVFPTSNLGSASRDEYARVMCASVVDQWMRDNA